MRAQAVPNGPPAPAPATGEAQRIQLEIRALDRGRRWLISLSTVSTGVLAMSAFAVWMAYTHEPSQRYFSVNQDGTLRELVAFGEPNQSNAAVQQWLTNALVDIFDYNYTNYRRRLAETTQKYFTERGIRPFLDALAQSGTLTRIEGAQDFVTLTVEGSPIFIEQGRDPTPGPGGVGVYRWIVEVNGKLHINSMQRSRAFNMLLHVVVERTSMRDSPHGLGIRSIVMTER